MSFYIKEGRFEAKLGNLDLPITTLIYNFESADGCTGKLIGKCKVWDICYAQKAETTWPTVTPYRERQRAFWKRCTPRGFISKLAHIPFKTFRFGEAGEIDSQESLDKLNDIAKILWDKRRVVTYGYSCMEHLDFRGSIARIKLSGYPAKEGTTGSTMVVEKGGDIPEGWHRCKGEPGKCTRCTICTQPIFRNVAMEKH